MLETYLRRPARLEGALERPEFESFVMVTCGTKPDSDRTGSQVGK